MMGSMGEWPGRRIGSGKCLARASVRWERPSELELESELGLGLDEGGCELLLVGESECAGRPGMGRGGVEVLERGE